MNTAVAGDGTYTKILTIECKVGYVALSNTGADAFTAAALSTAAKIGGCWPCFASGDSANAARYKTCTVTTTTFSSSVAVTV